MKGCAFMKNFQISIIGKGFVTNVLADKYDLQEEDGYLHAIIIDADSEPDLPEELLIYLVSRKLSENETSLVRVSENAVEKLEYKATRKIAGNITPCIAFCICKRSFDDVEVLIIPLNEIRSNAVTGGIFAASGRGLFYDYSKCTEGKPVGALFRAEFKRQLDI